MLEDKLEDYKIMVITSFGDSDPRISEYLANHRDIPKENIIYVSARKMPEKPIEGTKEILINFSPNTYFTDIEGHYDSIPKYRFAWYQSEIFFIMEPLNSFRNLEKQF